MSEGLVPKLRFPEFRDAPGWVPKSLGEVSVRVQKRVGDDKLTPVSISAGVGFVSQEEKFGRDISGAQYRNYVHLRKGDFSYNKGNSKRFPQGCVYALKEFEEAAVPNAFVSFRLREGYVNEFFQPQFEMNSHGRQLTRFITSGARSDGLLNISPEQFFTVELPVPQEEAEQRKIAECLTSLDELIAAEGRKMDALRAHKKGLMQDLFPREGETTPRLRFPEFRMAPAWETKPLGDLLSRTPEYGVNAAAVPYSPDLPTYIRITDIDDDGNFLAANKTSVDIEASDAHYLTDGDVVLARTGASVGKSYRCQPDDGRLVFAGFLIRVSPDKNKLDPIFLSGFLATRQYWDWVVLTSARSGQPGINSTEYAGMPVPLPPGRDGDGRPAEQQRIASCLASLNALISAQSGKLATLRLHKQGLMQGLFQSSECK